MKKNSAVRLSIVILLLLSVLITVGNAYAYWNRAYREITYKVNVDKEKMKVIEVKLEQFNYNLRLVPSGKVQDVHDVEMIVLTYIVTTNIEIQEKLNLEIFVDNIRINNQTKYAHLVEISINGYLNTYQGVFNQGAIIYIEILLKEPIDQEEGLVRGIPANVDDGKSAYEAINGQGITFDLVFRLSE